MCGICGKYSFDGELRVRKAEIGRMMETLEHRGPDQSGLFVDGPAGLGHRRLNIIDLDSGRQPILNETGTWRSSSTARSTITRNWAPP